MKIYVITGPDGKIGATIRNTSEHTDEFSLLPPIPLTGQKVHELEFPKELEQIKDPYELHRHLAQLIGKTDQDQDQDQDLVS
jgi:hypothetical protein